MGKCVKAVLYYNNMTLAERYPIFLVSDNFIINDNYNESMNGSLVAWFLILASTIFVGTWVIPFNLANGQNATEQMENTSDKQTLRGLATVNFYADDMQAAKKWYSELLGVEPYFARPDPERPAYIEFRIGDYQHELGIIDGQYAPKNATSGPGGEIAYWHVDNVTAVHEKLISMGAKEYEPVTKRGEAGFITASVVDPFGNILGIMYNPHFLEILSLKGE
jgi:predicted enzyme related to lactoylglutathione lyase